MTGRRDCTHTRTRHQHGTRAAYEADNCRCFPCRTASSRANQQRNWSDGLMRPSAGSRRRLQALASLGWSCQTIGDQAGLPFKSIHRLRVNTADQVTLRVHEAIAAAYEQLLTEGIPVSRGASRVRRHATANGWLPPIAWDDDTIDNPDAAPYASEPVAIDPVAVSEALAGRLVQLTPAEQAEAVRVATSQGWSASRIAARLGTTVRTVQRRRAAA